MTDTIVFLHYKAYERGWAYSKFIPTLMYVDLVDGLEANYTVSVARL